MGHGIYMTAALIAYETADSCCTGWKRTAGTVTAVAGGEAPSSTSLAAAAVAVSLGCCFCCFRLSQCAGGGTSEAVNAVPSGLNPPGRCFCCCCGGCCWGHIGRAWAEDALSGAAMPSGLHPPVHCHCCCCCRCCCCCCCCRVPCRVPADCGDGSTPAALSSGA